MAYSLISHVAANSPFSADTVTSSGVDTTGANLLVAMTSGYLGNPTLTDSYGNTWTALTAVSNGSGASVRLLYCANPSVGSGHTFTAAKSGGYPAVAVQAWSGSAASPFDQENGAVSSGTSSQATGSVTPSEDNELLVTGATASTSGFNISSVDSGFTTTDIIQPGFGDSSATYGMALAYLVQTTAASKNPTWTYSGTHNPTAVVATFKASAATGQPAMRRFGGFGNADFRCKTEGVKMWRVEPRQSGLLVPDRSLILPYPEMRLAN